MIDLTELRERGSGAIDSMAGSLHSEKIDLILSAISAAGYVIVPREPTEEMVGLEIMEEEGEP